MASIAFHQRQIDEEFHTGKSWGGGIHSRTQKWCEYKKVSKSQAQCVRQIGYGNTRLVGGLFSFSPHDLTFDIV